MPASPTGRTDIVIFVKVEHIESIFDMLDFYCPMGASDYGDDVIPCAAVLLSEDGFVVCRGTDDMAAFLSVHCFVRLSIVIRGACLHLYEDKGCVILVDAYKVDVRIAMPPVALPYIPAFLFHIFRCAFLTPASEVVMLCHGGFLFFCHDTTWYNMVYHDVI